MSKEKEELILKKRREETRKAYDKMSNIYDFLTSSEKKFVNQALERLGIKEGEKFLEIGYGTGGSLVQIAKSVGEKGKAFGIDISPKMLRKAMNRLDKAGLLKRTEVRLGDASKLPYDKESFDAVFMSFTLELFNREESLQVLNETKRVLTKKGHIGVVSLSNEIGDTRAVKTYKWFHKKFPKYIDCKPIYLEHLINDAGFNIVQKENHKLFRLPVEIVVGEK